MTTYRQHVCTPDVEKKVPFEQEHLDALERMRTLDPYYRWTLSLLEPYIGQRVMDAGCGVGNFSSLLAEVAGYVLAVDLSPANITLLRQRFSESSVVEVAQSDLDSDMAVVRDRQIDTIVCLDVLEHMEDDVAVLRRFYEVVQPGGHLLLKVPACKWLYGSVDEASSHYRRYSRRQLREKVERTKWDVLKIGYMNIWGVLPYWIKSRVLKKQRNFSRTFTPWQLRLLGGAMPMLSAVDQIVGPPVGLSVILVARRCP